jgi:hypothetical protein
MILDLIALDNTSRVWVYQAKDALTDEQLDSIKEDLYIFLNEWTSHHKRLYTYGNVFHSRFLTIFVDEQYAGASGCSIDKSVHFLQEMEKKYGIDLFYRMDMAYMIKDEDEEGEDISEIKTVPLSEVGQAYQRGDINDNTWVFDNLVDTKGAFLKRWVVPFGESWYTRYK